MRVIDLRRVNEIIVLGTIVISNQFEPNAILWDFNVVEASLVCIKDGLWYCDVVRLCYRSQGSP